MKYKNFYQKYKKIINNSMQLLIFAAIFYAASSFQERNMLPTDKQSAPYFSLPLLSDPNKRVSLGQFKGRTTIVYFFAPWCTICKLSMPNLEALHQDKQVNVIAIALNYTHIQEVKDFIKDHTLSMPIALGNAQLGQNYRVDAFPSYYVLDANLNIISRSRGYSTELGMHLRTTIALN